MRPWAKPAAIAGLLGVALFLIVHPAMLGIGGPVELPGWDLTRVFWADLAAQRRIVAEGSLPLWNPYDRGGYPFAAEPQSAVFDPLTWLWVGIALVLGSAPVWLTTVKVAVHYGIAAAGFDAWLRHHRLPAWSRALGVIALLMCGRMDKIKDQSALWPAAWAGWFLLALERCIAAPDWRRGTHLGAAVGMLVVTGYPPTAFRVGLLALPLAVVAVVEAVRAHEDRRAYVKQLARAGASAVVVAAGLSSAQIVATMQILPTTTRDSLDLGHVLASRVFGRDLLGFVAPQATTVPLMVYAGGCAITLAIIAVVWPVVKSTRARTLVLVLGVALGFALAMGENGPLLPALIELPGFHSFRISAHYLILCSLGLAALAAHGSASLELIEGRARIIAQLLLALGLLVWATTGAPRSGVAWIGGALGFLAAAGVLWLRQGWPATLARVLLPVAVVVELFAVMRPIAEILEPPPTTDAAEQLAALVDPQAARVADLRHDARRPGPHTGARDLIGHRPALTDPRYLRIYKAAAHNIGVLRAMNVGAAALPPGARVRVSNRVQPSADARGLFIIRKPWPRAYWIDGLRWIDNDEQLIETLQVAANPRVAIDRADVPASALAQLDALPHHQLRAYGGERSIAADLGARAGYLVADIDAPAPGLVVFSESPAPGWHARVDGQPATLVRVNAIQQAVWVPAGPHHVELRFWPRGTTALWLWWALTWLALGVAWAKPRRPE